MKLRYWFAISAAVLTLSGTWAYNLKQDFNESQKRIDEISEREECQKYLMAEKGFNELVLRGFDSFYPGQISERLSNFSQVISEIPTRNCRYELLNARRDKEDPDWQYAPATGGISLGGAGVLMSSFTAFGNWRRRRREEISEIVEEN
jgi:hypothetical protein